MPQSPWIGRLISGRYQIEELLGQGGMSAVYKATDPNLKRAVAIKLIHAHLAGDKQFIQRFDEEAAAVASLRHPNIVQVHDYNSDDGTYYMVLEFVPGETLQDRLQRLGTQGRNLAIDEAIHFALNICDALGYAHQRGIIHRDIKPANIMLDVYGQAILMDFGIVKILGNNSHTATGAVLGTARYIAPELIRSEPPDQRSDIYSLGISIYEMLSGKPPFQSDSSMSLMMMHLNDPVPDPRNLRTDIPAELVKILLKCLEKDRANRYQSTAELAVDLNHVLSTISTGTVIAPIQAAPASRTVLPLHQPALNQATSIEQPHPAPYTPTPNHTATIMKPPPAKKQTTWIWLFGLGGVFLFFMVIVFIGGVFIFSRRFAAVPVAAQASATNTAASIIPNTQAPNSPPVVPSSTSIATIAAATQIPASETPAPTPTVTLPPYYVRINSINLVGNNYSVDYETFGYLEKLPGMHVHFFFNTVAPDQAGMPGNGPWKLYGGPRPFTGYTTNQQPAGATQMCALVANANHTVIAGSGNCFDLP